MNIKKGISVIIPTYKRNHLLINCLDSILHQSLPPDEIIVVDNSPNKEAKKLINTFQKQTNIIINYFHEKKLGAPNTRNKGIKMARYSILAFIDDDCLADKNWVEEIASFFKKHPYKRAVMGKNLNGCPENLLATFEYYNTELYFKSYLYRYKNQYYSLALDSKNFAIKKSLLEKKYIFFDPLFPTNEDIDFGFQLQKKGFKIVFNPKMKIRHYGQVKLDLHLKKTFLSGVAREKLIKKWGGDILKKFLIKEDLLAYISQQNLYEKKIKNGLFYLFYKLFRNLSHSVFLVTQDIDLIKPAELFPILLLILGYLFFSFILIFSTFYMPQSIYTNLSLPFIFFFLYFLLIFCQYE